MQGFLDTAPLLVAVTWLKDANGVPIEVPLLAGEALPHGLMAQTNLGGNGDIVRWLVPWTSIVYIKQSIAASPPAQAPVVPPPTAPVTDTPIGGKTS